MVVKKYELHRTAKKTAERNSLSLVNGNQLSDNKMLFDFSLLDTLDIPEEEKEAVRKESVNHCSIANRTAFVFFHADDWTVCNVIADFNYHKVYNSKTWKLLYVILELKHIQYHHAERTSVYEQLYMENVQEFDVDSGTESAADDLLV